jgi:hypothetical protein
MGVKGQKVVSAKLLLKGVKPFIEKFAEPIKACIIFSSFSKHNILNELVIETCLNFQRYFEF